MVFRFIANEKVLFAIEVKEGNPNLTEVKDQLQNGINIMVDLLPNPKEQFTIIPVLCAEDFSGLKRRLFLSYRVKVFGEPTLIRKKHHGEDINTLKQ